MREARNTLKKENDSHFTLNSQYVGSTTNPSYQQSVDEFINTILKELIHNPSGIPYILERVYEIYDQHYDFASIDQLYYFSQKIIGGVQKVLGPCWLQYYARGDIWDNNHDGKRSFICRDSSKSDVRALVNSCIGGDSFLSIGGGRARGCGWEAGIARSVGATWGCFYKIFVEQKQHTFKTCYATRTLATSKEKEASLHDALTPCC